MVKRLVFYLTCDIRLVIFLYKLQKRLSVENILSLVLLSLQGGLDSSPAVITTREGFTYQFHVVTPQPAMHVTYL